MTQAFNLAQLANNLNTSGQLDATDGLVGEVPVTNGGSGRATLTANNLLAGNGTNAVNLIAPGASGNVLTSNGTSWASTVPGVSLSSFTGSNQSLSTNGYQKLPGGLIIQWGYTSTGATTFNITFPTAVLQAYALFQSADTGPHGASNYNIINLTTSGFTRTTSSGACRWLAIGY